MTTDPPGCSPPDTPDNARVIYPFDPPPALIVTTDAIAYECNEDFILDGSFFLRCLGNNQWFPSEPPRCLGELLLMLVHGISLSTKISLLNEHFFDPSRTEGKRLGSEI